MSKTPSTSVNWATVGTSAKPLWSVGVLKESDRSFLSCKAVIFSIARTSKPSRPKASAEHL